jgi:hypothetical protein
MIQLVQNQQMKTYVDLKHYFTKMKLPRIYLFIFFKRMLLYNCTICGLYPSLYCGNMPSSTTSLSQNIENELEDIQSKGQEYDSLSIPDLETTSEGLCDHIREVFGLNRQVFNDYQIRAMKKLLIKKSHSQVCLKKVTPLEKAFVINFFNLDTKRGTKTTLLLDRGQ